MKNRPTPVHVPPRDDAVTVEMPAGLADTAETVVTSANTVLSSETTEPMEPVESAPAPSPVPVPPPSSHRRPPARTRQLAKLAGLGVATAVLCASIATASIINSRRQADAGAVSRPVAEMTNEQALLPNLFTLGAANAPRMTTELPAPNKGSAAATVDNSSPGRRAVDKGNEGVDTQVAPVAEDPNPIDTELVRRYYKLLAEQPAKALGLLDGTLRQSDLSQFVDSWTQVRSIDVVDVQKRGDGELLAIVHMMLPDGGKARVQQLLRVTDGIPQRITGAEIISAQRS